MNYVKLPYQRLELADIEDNLRTNGMLTSLIDVCGFFLCKKGWVKLMSGRQTYTLQPGDVYIYTPSSFVRLIDRSDEVEGLAIKSTLDIVIPFAEKSIHTVDLMMLHERPCFSLTPEQMADIEELINILDKKERRLRDLPPEAPGRPILRQQLLTQADSFFQELLYAYFVDQDVAPMKQSTKSKIFQNFMLSLLRNYKKEREVAFYAAEQNLTPRYFSTVIREQTGYPASQWIVNMVISNCSQQLTHTTRSIKNIAIEYNFATQSFFGKYFKQATGMSPRDFRKAMAVH